jgi:hypothetical protein
MAELPLPRGTNVAWDGNVPTANISGVTFDTATNTLYLVGYPLGADVNTGRLYAMSIGAGSGTPPPPPSDTTAPSVTLTAPASGATVSGTVTLSASASDAAGVSSVWFTVDDVTVGGEDTSAPYQGAWNASTAASGTHVIRALARDAAGNTGASAGVTVSIASAGTDPGTGSDPGAGSNPSTGTAVQTPIVTLTTAHFRQCSATVSSAPPDDSGGWSVRFTRNGASFASLDAKAPYSQTASVGLGLSTFGATWTKVTSHGTTTLASPNVIGKCQ